jgi:LIVCS family branched-chain amino acid:cation transporter
MDTLGAMVFGIVIVNAARSRGVTEARLLTRYTIWAGLMAGVGLTLLYLALFRLGSDSATLVDQQANGAAILHAYVQHTFGGAGSMLLAVLIFLACLVTAVGLTCACAEFFAQYLPGRCSKALSAGPNARRCSAMRMSKRARGRR